MASTRSGKRKAKTKPLAKAKPKAKSKAKNKAKVKPAPKANAKAKPKLKRATSAHDEQALVSAARHDPAARRELIAVVRAAPWKEDLIHALATIDDYEVY